MQLPDLLLRVFIASACLGKAGKDGHKQLQLRSAPCLGVEQVIIVWWV